MVKIWKNFKGYGKKLLPETQNIHFLSSRGAIIIAFESSFHEMETVFRQAINHSKTVVKLNDTDFSDLMKVCCVRPDIDLLVYSTASWNTISHFPCIDEWTLPLESLINYTLRFIFAHNLQKVLIGMCESFIEKNVIDLSAWAFGI